MPTEKVSFTFNKATCRMSTEGFRVIGLMHVLRGLDVDSVP